MSPSEPTMVGLSERAHAKLKRLKEDGHFNEMTDAYRFGIALALAHGVIPDEVSSPKATFISVSTLDQSSEIYNSINALFNTGGTSVYKWAERLAEWGVEELARYAEAGEIDFVGILEKAE